MKTTPVIGVWDDHDYGCNNGDKTFPKKHAVREIFLDFIGEPADSDRRVERDTGIYQDYVIITPDKIKVHYILLDVRFDFDPDSRDRLGARQIEWLEAKFQEHKDSDITLIASGVQILPDRYFPTEHFEWETKKSLLDLIRKYEKSGVVLLSGDVHFAQFYHTNCQSLTGYNLPELTTSGLTHHVNGFIPRADKALNIATNTFWNVRHLVVMTSYLLRQVRYSWTSTLAFLLSKGRVNQMILKLSSKLETYRIK